MQCRHHPASLVIDLGVTPSYRDNTIPGRPGAFSVMLSVALASPRAIRTAAFPPLSSPRHPQKLSFAAGRLRRPYVFLLSAPVAPFIPNSSSKIFTPVHGKFWWVPVLLNPAVQLVAVGLPVVTWTTPPTPPPSFVNKEKMALGSPSRLPSTKVPQAQDF